MGSIKSLKLINFQSHKETQINFHEGLTVILGQTDQGKSAIIRALKWVLYNEPRGTDFITAGCKYCRVELEMQDGSKIIRERDGQRNRYILEQNGQEHIFEGFGNTVPLEIVKAHGIPKIFIDRDATSAVNLAEQLEPPFLISESGSNRAKALGRLVGIHIIDAAQRTTLKDLVDKQQRYKLLEEEIENIRDELQAYNDVDELEKKISKLSGILEKLKQKRNILFKLTQLQQELEPTDIEIEKNKGILSKLDFIEEAEKNIRIIDALHSKYNYLCQLMKKLALAADSIKVEQELVKATKSLDSIEVYYTSILKLAQKQERLINIRRNLIDNERNTNGIKRVLKDTENAYFADILLLEAGKLLEALKRYISIRDKWRSVDYQLGVHTKEIAQYIHMDKSEHYLTELSQKMKKLSLLQNIKDSILTVESSINKGEAYLEKLESNLALMAKEYSQLLERLSICPTCLAPIDKETTQKIVSDLLN
ncbi:MAG: AAA family ATPase [Tepidanaerobacteraceae bacterium]